MYKLKEDSNYPFYYVFNLDYENNLIKVFFNKNDLNLIGWETKDIYQNIVQTFISDIQKNIPVNNKMAPPNFVIKDMYFLKLFENNKNL